LDFCRITALPATRSRALPPSINRPYLGERNERIEYPCVRTVSFPHQVVGIVLQVLRTGFPQAAIQATPLNFVERFAIAVFDGLEIETQHFHSTIQKIVAFVSRRGFSIRTIIRSLHQILLRSPTNRAAKFAFVQ
jgi:hypothetical protein